MLHLAVTTTGMGYVVTVVDPVSSSEIARFEVDSLERTGWGLMATITVRSKLTGARSLRDDFITTERCNLLSARSRGEFGNRLTLLMPAPAGASAIDWERLVEDVLYSVMEQERVPLALIDLSTVPPSAQQEYLLPALLPKNKATILYGAGGTGKSALAVAIAVAVQTGATLLGWTPEKANVLYCDWETDEGDLSHRVQLASKGLGLPYTARVGYINFTHPLEAHQAALATLVAERNVGLVIIDSTAMATAGARDGADLATGAINFFRALRALGCTVLAIDHISSDDQRKGKGAAKPYGSVFKWNSARNAFELLDATQPGGPHTVILRHRKANLGGRVEDIALEFDWQDDLVRVLRSNQPVHGLRSIEERIREALMAGSATSEALTVILNDSPGEDRVNSYEVRSAVTLLRRAGEVDVELSGNVTLIRPEKDNEAPDDGQEDLWNEQTTPNP